MYNSVKMWKEGESSEDAEQSKKSSAPVLVIGLEMVNRLEMQEIKTRIN
jgi:hypothetical protein